MRRAPAGARGRSPAAATSSGDDRVDDDGSHWIGGLFVDAAVQRSGIARAAVTLLRDRLAAEPGCPTVVLSYPPGNAAARQLAASFGFAETGETEDDGAEVVARWTPSR